ncbi:MAG: DegT/DnrJ/EryC1/StrS family aminotransferase, partial [Caldilineaceae bacterium]|nr:DegT/DnrJ/EryC1/StrS family aminotransferase [Caldilineaceae bacterium]
AFLYGQLEVQDDIQARRRAIWHIYADGFRDWAPDYGIQLPVVPAYCEQPYHMFYLLLPSLDQRQALIQHLKEQGISSVFHYLPLHLSDMGRRFGGREGDCPVTESVSDRLLRLPFHNRITPEEQQRVIVAVRDFAKAHVFAGFQAVPVAVGS